MTKDGREERGEERGASLFSGLIKQNVARLVRSKVLSISEAKESLNGVWLNLLGVRGGGAGGGYQCEEEGALSNFRPTSTISSSKRIQ